MMDPKVNGTTIVPDEFGRTESETDELGHVTRYDDFDATGQPQTVVESENPAGTDPGQRTWRYCYDAAGNVVRVTDPRGIAVDCASTEADAPFSARLRYDAFDRLTDEWLPKDSSAGEYIHRFTDHDRNGNVTTS